MNIKPEDWHDASGGYVVDTAGQLWRIIGFIDRPAVILDPVDTDQDTDRNRETIVMGTEHSNQFARLVVEMAA